VVAKGVFQLGLFSWLRSGPKVSRRKKRSISGRVAYRPRRPVSRGVDIPELKQLWLTLRSEFFPERHDLDDYVVRWSRRRQKRTLASCNIIGRVVAVAKEMKHQDATAWLAPLLYHEMCHAVLGTAVTRQCGKRAWHGREFKSLECRHPQISALDAWIKSGGFHAVVRSERARSAWSTRKIGSR